MPNSAARRNWFSLLVPQSQSQPFAVDADDETAQLAISAHFDNVVSAFRDALEAETFTGILQTTAPSMIRDIPIVVQTIHNPTANAVTVSLSLDAGSPVMFKSTLAAGATLVNLQLKFARLAGFVGTAGDYVTIGGTLPTH